MIEIHTALVLVKYSTRLHKVSLKKLIKKSQIFTEIFSTNYYFFTILGDKYRKKNHNSKVLKTVVQTMNCLLKLNCLLRWHYAMQYLKYSEYYSNVTTIITRRIFNNLLKKYFRSHNSWQNLRCIYVISVSFFGGGEGKGSMSWALANTL